MNTRKYLVSILSLVCVLLSACAPKPATPAVDPTQPIPAKVLAEISGLGSPGGITFGFGSVWVQNHRSGATDRIDPDSNKVIATIPTTITQFSARPVVAGDMLWVEGSKSTILIDPKTNAITATLPESACTLAYGFNSVWSIGGPGQNFERLDPTTGKVIASIALPVGSTDSNICYDARITTNSVWAITDQKLIKIDPAANNIVSSLPLDQVIANAKAGTTIPAGKAADFIWLMADHGLVRIDPNTGAGLTFLPLNYAQYGLQTFAVGDTSIWLMGLGFITQVNVTTNKIQATYQTHDNNGYADIGTGLGSVWVTYMDTNLVQRLDIRP